MSEFVIDLEEFSIHPPGRNMPIVRDLTFKVKRGKLVALMGGSGCGKTTLMLFLTRRMRDPFGAWGITGDKTVIPHHVEFVAQKEMFYAYDTAERHLLFIRQSRFRETFEESREAVRRTLKLVGLDEEEKWYTLIGEAGRDSALSGGERRLLTIAAALVVEPEMVILDEPTTGLDAFTALMVTQHLKRIAAADKTTFVVSIHQPSEEVLRQFDTVKFMTPPAATYANAVAKASSNFNPAESEAWDSNNETTAPENSVVHAGFFGKLWHLFRLYMWRASIRAVANWRAAPLRIIVALVFAVMCGVAWVRLDFTTGSSGRDVLGMMLAIIGLSFAPLILNATLFSLEKDLMLEEHVHLDNIQLFSDMLSRLLIDLLIAAVASAATLVAAPIIGIRYVGYFFLTTWMQSWCADSFGFWISMFAEPHIAIGVIVPTVGFLSIALGTGLIQPTIENEGYIFHVAKWISFFKYGFQAIALMELPRLTTPCNTCLIPTGEAMLDYLHLRGNSYDDTIDFQYLMLFIFTIVLRLLSYFTVRILIAAGNRRYSYDPSSAGGLAQSPASPVADPASPSVHIEMKHEEPRSQSPIGDAAGWFRWKLHPAHVVLSFVDVILAKVGGAPLKDTSVPVLRVRDFSLKQGQAVALMGPTGAGKSLLLRALVGRVGDGVELLDKTLFYSSETKAAVQFVDGNETFFAQSQTIEPVAFYAKLCDASVDQAEAEERAARQLLDLGIVQEKHHNAAYTLSGGQLRRLSVACKAVMRPAVLCMDEPTSGLDHDAANNLGERVSELAHKDHMAVICSLQQPDPALLDCFDRIIFMKDGDIFVDGTADECRAYLGLQDCDKKVWAEEALVKLSTDASLRHQATEAKPAPESKHCQPLHHHPQCSLAECTWQLTKRSFTNRWLRSPGATIGAFLIRYLLLPVTLSILVVNIGNKDPYYFNRSGLIYVYCACITFSSLLSGAVNFPTQRKNILDEIDSSMYSPLAYLLSQWFTNTLIEDFVGCVLGSIALKYIASLQASLGIIIVASFLTTQTAEGLGFICGLNKALSVASGLTVLILMPFMMGADAIVTTDQILRIPLMHVFEALSTIRYSYLLIFWSELRQGTSSLDAAVQVYSSYGLQANPSTWYDESTLWPVFCCYMVFSRVITVLIYGRAICPTCND